MAIYRAVNPDDVRLGELIQARSTSRPPGNVPYVVDNLWEWMRPEHFPCRRQAVFASPSAELALKSGAQGAHVYEVEFAGEFIGAQTVGLEDSKFHPECRTLRRLLLDKLKQPWVDAGMDEKALPGRLWMPCLKKAEVQLVLDMGEQQGFWSVAEIAEAVRYWDTIQKIEDPDILPDPCGEVFFVPTAGYRLHGVSACVAFFGAP